MSENKKRKAHEVAASSRKNATPGPSKRPETVAGTAMRGSLLKTGRILTDHAPHPGKIVSSSSDDGGNSDESSADNDDASDGNEPHPKRRKVSATKRKAMRAKSKEKGKAKATERAATERKRRSASVIDVDDEEETEEAKLMRKAKGWTSPYYAFYKAPFVDTVNERTVHVFRCQFCQLAIRRYQDKSDANSPSSLQKHAIKCQGKEAVDAAVNSGQSMTQLRKSFEGAAKGGNKNIKTMFDGQRKAGATTYSNVQHTPGQTRLEIIRWCAENCRPFEIVGDRGFNNLMKTGRQNYWIPHPTTVSRDTKRAFAITCQRLAKMLQEYEGEISLATDCWTSPNHRAFMAITAHIVVDNEPVAILLDFLEVAERHTGATLACEFAKVLCDFGIQHKSLSIAGDNASNNDVMIEDLGDNEDTSYPGKSHHVRCFAHTVNLVAKAFLRLFDPPDSKKKKKQDADDPFGDIRDALQRIQDGDDVELDDEELELMAAAAAADTDAADEDPDQQNVANDGLSEEDEDDPADEEEHLSDPLAGISKETAANVQAEAEHVRGVLIKLRTISFKTIHSTTYLLNEWKATLAGLGLPIRIIPRDVRTRWNSTYDMVDFALQHRSAINSFTGVAEHGLRDFELSAEEWDVLIGIRDILEVLKHATLWFSSSSPTLADVIPAMDEIDAVFATRLITRPVADDTDTLETIEITSALALCCQAAKHTLNKYYALTDESELYRIAMILHPEHKLEYFQTQKWLPSWIDGAFELCKTKYNTNYRDRRELLGGQVIEAAGPSSPVKASCKSVNMFQPKRTKKSVFDQDELDRYIRSDTEPCDNVIQWWTDQRTSFPHLSRMALDYHSIPATSVAVERVFSRARRLITWERNRLSPQSTRALMCLGSWSLMGYVHDNDLEHITKDGAVHPKRSEKALLDVELPDGYEYDV